MPGLNSNLVDSLRKFIIDLPEYNQLNFNEEELSIPLIEAAVKDGIMRFDLLPPISSTSADSLLETSKHWYFIKRLSAVEAIQMIVFKNVRNKHTVSDPGMINVDEFDKAAEWDVVKNNIISEIEPKIIQYKRALSFAGMNAQIVSFL